MVDADSLQLLVGEDDDFFDRRSPLVECQYLVQKLSPSSFGASTPDRRYLIDLIELAIDEESNDEKGLETLRREAKSLRTFNNAAIEHVRVLNARLDSDRQRLMEPMEEIIKKHLLIVEDLLKTQEQTLEGLKIRSSIDIQQQADSFEPSQPDERWPGKKLSDVQAKLKEKAAEVLCETQEIVNKRNQLWLDTGKKDDELRELTRLSKQTQEKIKIKDAQQDLTCKCCSLF